MEARRRRVEYPALRWALAVGALAFVAAADWFADGLGPRLVLGSATLHLHSDPSAARVLVDGAFVGETPLRHAVRPGEIVVRFEHRFHDATAMRVRVQRDDERRVDADFAPAFGTLEIVSNPRGAELTLDGEPLAEVAPVVLADIPTRAYEVQATILGRQTKTKTVDVLPRQRAEVSFELERIPFGQLHVALVPADAVLAIHDVAEPYRSGMMLPLGRYQMSATRDGYASEHFTMYVRHGENRHTVRLQRLFGRLSLTTRPEEAQVEVSFGEGANRRTVPAQVGNGPRIPVGPFEISARAFGYRRYERRLAMPARGLQHTVRMERINATPGQRLRDPLRSGGEGPLLAVVPAGRFRMGSETGAPDERPVRAVDVFEPFAMGVFEVTQCEFDRHAQAGAALDQPSCAERGLPVTNVTWQQATTFLNWLNDETGKRYRLPSEAEWEYAARAGSTARFPHGDDAAGLCAFANIADRTLAMRFTKHAVAPCEDGQIQLATVGGYPANAFGLHDMLGNAEEWVADCWQGNHRGAPPTADARASGPCRTRVVRGGRWDSAPEEATVSYRSFSSSGNSTRGFRVVREL